MESKVNEEAINIAKKRIIKGIIVTVLKLVLLLCLIWFTGVNYVLLMSSKINAVNPFYYSYSNNRHGNVKTWLITYPETRYTYRYRDDTIIYDAKQKYVLPLFLLPVCNEYSRYGRGKCIHPLCNLYYPLLNSKHINSDYIDNHVKHVEYAKGVTYLPKVPSRLYEGLTEYTIPQNVSVIESEALAGLDELEKVEMSNKVTKIGDYAFANCTSLEEIELSDNLEIIGIGAFSGCESLEEIEIPDGVVEIGYSAFYGCESLEEIYIPDGVVEIGGSAFYGCELLEEIYIPDSVTFIGSDAFLGCSSLEEIYLSESITEINNNTFRNCESLKEIYIPEGVTSIGSNAFSGCSSLEIIELPESIEEVRCGLHTDYGVFKDCESLKEIRISENSQLDNIDEFVPEGVEVVYY